jgi:hypothetical protein
MPPFDQIFVANGSSPMMKCARHLERRDDGLRSQSLFQRHSYAFDAGVDIKSLTKTKLARQSFGDERQM